MTPIENLIILSIFPIYGIFVSAIYVLAINKSTVEEQIAKKKKKKVKVRYSFL